MPRVVRGLADNYVYHIINRGNGRQEVFHKEKDYEAFIDIMKEAKERYSVKLFSYCLMPNHFHMVVMPERGDELSKCMQWLMTSHVRRYHRHYGSSGHIWQGRFKSFIVQKDSHLLMAMRYVEGNPLRAGLVSSAKEWPWSSHREMIGGKKNILAGEVPLDLPENWERYIDEPLTYKELERVRQSVVRQSPYGKPDWQTKVCKELGLESTLNPKGRPKKEKKA
ncbi:MAG: hypothetical protein FD156_1102 [Nitrospirae bacterium]|nr:MAG: hypothetical protein FD156_1102 [Nitrospirota bacterium]